MRDNAETIPTRAALPQVSPPVWLYGLVVFLGAWLVFWIQPLAVRGILPVLGGSPAVWNTAMVFFQSALLAGYALAHLLVRHASPTAQLAVLALLWGCVALAAPVGELRPLGDHPSGLPPALWLLGTLSGALGVAFVAASSLTPLVQAWLARAGTGAASADPYFLYSASNAGSAGALLAYPFLLEPLLGLNLQAWIWSAVLLGLAPLLVVLWLACKPHRCVPDAGDAVSRDLAHALRATRILALSAVPSGLLLAHTRYLTTDVASVPLLWVLPLVLYLGSFVHGFARRQLIPHRVLTRFVAPILILVAVSYPFSHIVVVFGVHILAFALIALYCHGELARLRPPASDLTRFYLLVSSGGLAGGLLVALVAPLIFVDVHEYPIFLSLVAALLPAAAAALRRAHAIVAAVALTVTVLGLSTALIDFGAPGAGTTTLDIVALGLVALAAPALLVLRARPALLASSLIAVFLVPTAVSRGTDVHVASERTFFGVYRIVEHDGKRTFYHGTTLHGAEWPRADGTVESRTTYYGLGTPYSELLHSLALRPSNLVIALAGLGTGSLACYARPGDEVHVYEIDPVVVDLARTHFAALRNCAPNATVAIGDARLLLEREQTAFDFLALDTFASDAIPVHLLTLEAFESYLRILAPQGVIAVHISNRHLDLEPVLAALASRLGLAARIKRYTAPHDVPTPRPAESSTVVVLGRDEHTLRSLELDADWVALGSPHRVRLWTDDYASILPLFKWW